MINVQYEHPPRDLSFYAPIFLAVAVIMAPIFVLIPWWTQGVAPLPALLLLAVATVLRMPAAALNVTARMIVLTDLGIPKAKDVSSENRPLPEALSEIALKLELAGFERFGEYETRTAASQEPEPVIVWAYCSPGRQIIASLLLAGNPKTVVMAFSTFGETGLVETHYPEGHQVKLPNARFSGVRSSVEAAYRHHLAEVRRLKPTMGRILKVMSPDHFLRLELKFTPESKVQIRQVLIDSIVREFGESLSLAPVFAFTAGLIFPDTFMPNRPEWIWIFPVLVSGVILSGAIRLRSRGIVGPKAA